MINQYWYQKIKNYVPKIQKYSITNGDKIRKIGSGEVEKIDLLIFQRV